MALYNTLKKILNDLDKVYLSENRARVDDGKLAFKFVLRNFDKFDAN